jgi:site-specific DNA recombinase
MVQPTPRAAGDNEESAQLATWLKARVVDNATGQRTRLAWMGRTSDDEVQDPTISLPRQLRSCQAVLGDDMEIGLFFWDVETSRKDLAARGSSTAWRKFDIDIPRDGGIADLLAEARRPDRRFDGVICESIDRIARLTYQSTKIEYDLEQLGIPLIAADEPIMRSARTGRIEKRAGMVLLRRAKQGVAEWYVLEMLEKSRQGHEIHTDQGFNIGKPPYGYLAERIPHPVPVKRAEGRHKTKLAPDPKRGPVVTRIFEMRVHEGLSYRLIAARLNDDLKTNPPPVPVDPTRALGRWMPGSVRDVLTNPKYTGYMVWNRRAMKHKVNPGKGNPRDEWVFSSRPEHPALVPMDLFLAAQTPPSRREKARADQEPMAANPHPQTRHTYRLRSYVFCVVCGRRMHGKRTPAGTVYFYCGPRDRVVPKDHPASVWVHERRLVDAVTTFFNTHVLGPDRRALAAASLPAAEDHAIQAHHKQEQRIQRQLDDLNGKADNLLRAFENNSDPDGLIFQRLRTRMLDLDREIAALSTTLAELRANAPEPPTDNIGLLDHLPLVEVDLNELAADRLRRFLEAFRVQIPVRRARTRRATLKAEISAHLIEELTRVAQWGRPRPDIPELGGSHSSELCPRQDSNLRSRLRRAVLYPLSYGGSATHEEYQGPTRAVGAVWGTGGAR